ncbi:helix-turn-helix domain-containing protein [Acidithiobacillus ferrivorans]|uniref:helix-turn-helix domain-containing protein n=1 Tax=Acidithiobacillus ferrivorans TaxID=160808 RepID=UPI001C07D5E9
MRCRCSIIADDRQGRHAYARPQGGYLSQSTISAILAGRRSISKKLAIKLAERLHVSPVVFF